MNVGELCIRDVVVLEIDAPVLQAAQLMRQYHVGDIVVVEQPRTEKIPLGILTDRDIVIGLIAEELDPRAVTVGNIMSAELLTASEDDDVIETLKHMRNKGVRRIPVVNRNGGLEGILALDDLLDFLAEQINDLVSLINREQKLEQTKSA